MSKVVVPVPVPRVVTGVLRRRRNVERILVHDVVPVLVPSLAGADAPVVARIPVRSPSATTDIPVRLGAGAVWRPMDDGLGNGAATPDTLAAEMLGRLPFVAGLRETRYGFGDRQELGDWRSLAKGCSKADEVPAFDPRLFSRIDDDGLADQRAALARIQANLVVVDGTVHHRSPVPYLVVEEATGIEAVSVVPRLWHWPVRGEAAPGHPTGWACFAIDAADDATAFAEGLSRRLGEVAGRPFSVVRHEAWAEPGLAQWGTTFPDRASDWADSFCREMQGVAGFLDDDGLSAYLDLRRTLARGVPDDATALSALDALAALARRVEGLADGHSWTNDMTLRMDVVARQAANVRLRMEAVEAPRLGAAWSDPDTEALAGLVGGM